ncbi:cytochrome P450 [Hysterangium stoloniferum]|nr:cytochrome P450 [Hysterangium stoloniferum]
MLNILTFASALLFGYFLWQRYFIQTIRSPPGPKPAFLFGHTFQIPKTKTWRYFEQLGFKYGPIVKLSLAGDDIVILNDPKDAEELLARRSHNYSSRKPLVYAGRHLSHNKRLVLLPYGPLLKKQRLAFHQMLQPRVMDGYQPMQLTECSKLLFDTLTAPQESFLNVKRFSASLVFTLAYGRRLSPNDEDLKEVLDILDNFIDDCYPGRHLVDTFPILDSPWVPDFVATWRAKAKKKHEREIGFYLRLLNEVKYRMDSGETQLECFSARLWSEQPKHGLDAESMAYVAGSAFEAGTGTTSGTMLFFFMAMILYPQVLKKAQKEIDDALGDADGPPTFSHMQNLPYSIALCKEVFRWIPAAPGGFPHYSDNEDIYKGYDIRAHTMIIPNIWAMQHNPSIFENPMTFKPERFLRDGGVQLSDLTEGHYAFGFGRRICPGQHLGARSVWIGIVQLIWGFNMTRAVDRDGHDIPISTDAVTSGINIEPEPFEMKITPRSEQHALRIKDLWKEHESTIMAGSG